MKHYKKIIIPIDIRESSPAYLRSLHDMEFLRQSDIFFVHVFPTITYTFAFGTLPSVYPVEEDRKTIEESINSLLLAMARNMLGNSFEGNAIPRVLFSDNPKKTFAQFVVEQNPNLVIIPTRSKHGLFDSSFAAYVNSHTECDVMMIKHKV